jgi:hypothetical protein
MATTHPERPSPGSDSPPLNHPLSFFAADPHVMNSQLELHFPSRTHGSDSSVLEDFGAALFGHPNLVSLDSALGLHHTILDPRRGILISTPEQDMLNASTTTNTPSDHHPSPALRSQPASQPRTLAGKQTDASGPLQLQFIIGPECSRSDESVTHVPSAASLYQVVHPNVDDVIVNFDTKASLAMSRVSNAPLNGFHLQSKSFPRRTKTQCANQIDPYAEDFLRHRLGEEKWQTFSSRLFERRLGTTRSRTRASRPRRLSDGSDSPESKPTGASAVDFLVKVEVVKEVLRTFVPWVYQVLLH